MRMTQIQLEELVQRAIEENPNTFPSSNSISPLVKKRKKILSEHLDWDKIQTKWIRGASDEQFLAAFTGKKMNKVSDNVDEEISRRVHRIVVKVMKEHPSVFPTANTIHDETGLEGKVVRRRANLTQIQVRWMKRSKQTDFLRVMSTASGYASDDVNLAVNERLQGIVEKKMERRRDVFPNLQGIMQITGLNKKITVDRLDMEKIEGEWIENSPKEYFLRALANNQFNSAKKGSQEKVDKRLQTIVEEKARENPEVFPTAENMAPILNRALEEHGLLAEGRRGNIGFNILKRRVNFREMQISWIRTCEEKDFFRGLSSRKMGDISDEIDGEISARLEKIVVGIIAREKIVSVRHLLTHLPISITGLLGRLPNVTQIVDEANGVKTKLSTDQALIPHLGLFRGNREAWVHELIKERLEQLWFFRETIALLKNGFGMSGTVFSFSHESLPDKIENVVPGADLDHYFVDDLCAGPVEVKQGPVVLLSVLPWATDEKNAHLLRNLALSVREGTEVFVTYSLGRVVSPEAEELLEQLGFSLESVGLATLIPSRDLETWEQEKLTQRSGLLTLIRTGEESMKIEKAKILMTVEKENETKKPNGTNHDYSYGAEILSRTSSAVVLYSSRVKITEGLAPELIKLSFQKNPEHSFLLEFKGGEVVGYNMDPRKPSTLEIVSNGRINRRVLDSVTSILGGNDPGVHVGLELGEKYREMLATLKTRRLRVGAIRTRSSPGTKQRN